MYIFYGWVGVGEHFLLMGEGGWTFFMGGRGWAGVHGD